MNTLLFSDLSEADKVNALRQAVTDYIPEKHKQISSDVTDSQSVIKKIQATFKQFDDLIERCEENIEFQDRLIDTSVFLSVCGLFVNPLLLIPSIAYVSYNFKTRSEAAAALHSIKSSKDLFSLHNNKKQFEACCKIKDSLCDKMTEKKLFSIYHQALKPESRLNVLPKELLIIIADIFIDLHKITPTKIN